MGAYENPAMIVDKSGEILAAGILQGVEKLAQGIDKYSQTVGQAWQERIKEQREEAKKKSEQNKQALIDGAKTQANFISTAATQGDEALEKTEHGVVATSIVSQQLQNIKDNSQQSLGVFANANNLNNSGQVLADNILKSEELIANAKKPFTWAANTYTWQTAASDAYTNAQGTVLYDNDKNSQAQSGMIRDAIRQDVFQGKISPSISFTKTTDVKNSSLMNLEFFDENKESRGSYQLDMNDPNAMDRFFGKGLDYTGLIKESGTPDKVNTNGTLKRQFFKERINFRDGDSDVQREVYNIEQIAGNFGGVLDTIVNELTTFSSETSGSDYLQARQWVVNKGYTIEQADAILKNEKGGAEVGGVDLPTPREMAVSHLLEFYSNDNYEYRDGQFFKETRTKRQKTGGGNLTENEKDAIYVTERWGQNINDIGVKGRKFVLKPVTVTTQGQGAAQTKQIKQATDAAKITGYVIYGEQTVQGNIVLNPIDSAQKVYDTPDAALQAIGNSSVQIFNGVNVE